MEKISSLEIYLDQKVQIFFFIIKETKEAILDFSQVTVRVLPICFS